MACLRYVSTFGPDLVVWRRAISASWALHQHFILPICWFTGLIRWCHLLMLQSLRQSGNCRTGTLAIGMVITRASNWSGWARSRFQDTGSLAFVEAAFFFPHCCALLCSWFTPARQWNLPAVLQLNLATPRRPSGLTTGPSTTL